MSKYKIYCLSIFCVTFFLLALVSIVNYKIDPGNLFGIHALYYKRIASLLTSGESVLIKKQNFDERLMQKSIISKLKRPIDMVILGSSRVRSLGSRNLCQNQTIFNFAVSDAVLQDDLAITKLLISHHRLPKTIIIGLDPWLLNSSNGEIRWESLRIEYNQMLEKIGFKERNSFLDRFYTFTKLTQLISWPYFFSSIHELKNWSAKRYTIYEPTDQTSSRQYVIKYSDGSYRPASYRDALSSFAVSKMVANNIAHYPLYSLGGFSHMSTKMRKIFVDYVEYLLRHHVKLVFYLPPYVETEASFIFKDHRYKDVLLSERFFQKLARLKHIMVIGSYSAADLKLATDDFMDGKHLKYNAFHKIFTKQTKDKLCKLKT